MDAIRDLFYHAHDLDWNETIPTFVHDGTTVMQVLADFVIYVEQGDAYAGLIEANFGYSNKRGIREVRQQQTAETYRSLLCSSNELLKIFIQKSKNERAGVPAPDLMARCKCHSQAGTGRPCYLDK